MLQGEEQEKVTIECLRQAILDTQEVIRSYDIKAEILAILLTLIVGVTSQIVPAELTVNGKLLLKCSWFLCLATIFFLGLVLKPKNNLYPKFHFGTFTPKGTYHIHQVNTNVSSTVSSVAANALATNWVEELTYESMKLSLIRDRKHCIFVYSLWPASATIVTLGVGIIIGY